MAQLAALIKETMTELAKIESTPYRKYTVEQVVDALAECKGMISPAARYLGCGRRTIQRYMKEYPEIAQAIEDADEEFNDVAELRLYDAVQRGEAWAVCFRLKTKAKNRGYVEKAEISGSNGQPIAIKLVYDE
jgi:hypothetical protein